MTVSIKSEHSYHSQIREYMHKWASPVAQTVEKFPAMQETQVRILGQEYFLEKGMATHCNILAWRIPCTEKPGGL